MPAQGKRIRREPSAAVLEKASSPFSSFMSPSLLLLLFPFLIHRFFSCPSFLLTLFSSYLRTVLRDDVVFPLLPMDPVSALLPTVSSSSVDLYPCSCL